jgi:ABC-type uncharacterized transport system fused permease/ATPase subunit
VTYPDSWVRVGSKGVSDEDLKQYLSTVKLDYILEREGGWDATADWMDVLSGGEKQRIAVSSQTEVLNFTGTKHSCEI